MSETAEARRTAPRGPDGRFRSAVPPLMLDISGAAARSGVAGALHCDPPGEPIRAGGLTWTAADAGPHAASIGLALAIETAGDAA